MFVGMDPTTIELKEECEKIEVIMILSSTYDFITLKSAERKRKRRYKNSQRYIDRHLRKVFLKRIRHASSVSLNHFIRMRINHKIFK